MMNSYKREHTVSGLEKEQIWVFLTKDFFPHACGGPFFFLLHLLGQECFHLLKVSQPETIQIEQPRDQGYIFRHTNTHLTLGLNTHTETHSGTQK